MSMKYPIDNKAIWRKWILVVLWVFQMISEVAAIGANGYRIGLLSYILASWSRLPTANTKRETSCSWDGTKWNCLDDTGVASTVSKDSIYVALGASGFAVTMAIIFFLTHIAQCVQFGRHRLSPAKNFGYDCSRFVISTIILIVTIASSVVYGVYVFAMVGAVFNWILYLFGIIYASIIFHRYRHGRYDTVLPITSSPATPFETQSVHPNKPEAAFNNTY